MNPVDIAIIVVVIVAASVGYLQGLVRQATALIGLYLATILAVQYHIVVGGWLGIVFNTDIAPRSSVGFLLVFVWAALFLGWIARRAYPATRILALGIFDNLAGGMLGVLTGGVVVCIMSTGLRFAVSMPWPSYEATRLTLDAFAHNSRLMPTVLNYAPTLYSTVTPWFSGGIPAILAF